MSNLVYPVLPGLTFGAIRTPSWSSVVKTAASGREYRSSLFQVPRYKYALQYEFLRSQAAYSELQTLLGFFNQVHGNWDSFLFTDPDDNVATAQAFGTDRLAAMPRFVRASAMELGEDMLTELRRAA